GEETKTADTPAVPATTNAAATPEMHPEVKKALDENAALRIQMESLQKSLEVKDLTVVAKKYEIIGKKADELAPKLYEMKKAGGTAYDDYVALLDEHLTTVEKSGMFGEVGTARSGTGAYGAGVESDVMAKASEIAKSADGMTSPEAIVKAFESNPELLAQYDAEYMKGRI
ncbi:MAG: hypothetical protein FWG45_08165, partial [Oscillospiraceae bacterium]|nr:hypothetical protein [Oscillospiraceae bacterium]